MADLLQTFCVAHDARIDTLIQTFGAYQPQAVNRAKLFQWLGQFDAAHYALALKLFETVEYYDLPRTHALLRQLHPAIKAQLKGDGFAMDDVYFVGLGAAGKSGHEIAYRYRVLNRVELARMKLVPELPDIIYEAATKGKRLAVVFLDDFIGSGKTVTDYWGLLTQILSIPPRPAMYVGCCVACELGIERIEAIPTAPFQVVAVHNVPDRLMLGRSNVFTNTEKQIIRQYCVQVGNQAQGFGNIELMLAFAHGAPNNTLSALRGSKGQNPWRGILPRFNDLP